MFGEIRVRIHFSPHLPKTYTVRQYGPMTVYDVEIPFVVDVAGELYVSDQWKPRFMELANASDQETNNEARRAP